MKGTTPLTDEHYPMLHKNKVGGGTDTTGTTVTPSSPTDSLRQLASDTYCSRTLPLACLLETTSVQPAYVRVKPQRGQTEVVRVTSTTDGGPCSFASFLTPETRARRAATLSSPDHYNAPTNDCGGSMLSGRDSLYVAKHCTCFKASINLEQSTDALGPSGQCCFLIGSTDHVTVVPCKNNPDILPDISSTIL